MNDSALSALCVKQIRKQESLFIMDMSSHYVYDYDVFLSYNSQDREIVEAIAAKLQDEANLLPFLDKWCLVPGEPWQEAIEVALDRTASYAVFLGQSGIGPWENEEMRAALDIRATNKSIRVIPVLLPGAKPKDPKILPRFLRRLTWVDYRGGLKDKEALRHLVSGICGVQPGRPRDKEIPPLKRMLSPMMVHALPPGADFQDRPELEIIRGIWRRDVPRGVVALIGIGGSGKTALVARFLQELPGSGISSPKVEKREDLPNPEAVFVWSFYELPDVGQFISTLYYYLTGNVATPGPTSYTAFRLLQSIGTLDFYRTLVVLDGLETVQEGRGTGVAFGLLRDSSLRHLLRRIAQGIEGFLVLLTSRFPIPDLLGFQASGYWQVDTDYLDAISARNLLRARGVIGTDNELDDLFHDFGSHALTLDHLGVLLRDFFDGKPYRAKELPALEDVGGEAYSDYQAYRLARIFEFYEHYLPQAEMRLLRNLSVFRLPVDVDILAEIFSQSRERTDKASSKVSKVRFLEILRRLRSRRLVSLHEHPPKTLCSVHPSIRDHFYRSLGEESVLVHDQVGRHLVSLVERPERERFPRDTPRLNLLEELIYHTLRSGDIRETFRYYGSLLGGYEHLGWRLGAYQRGRRITSAFRDTNVLAPVAQEISSSIMHDHALFLMELGRVKEAERVLGGITHYPYEDEWPGSPSHFRHIAKQNLSDILILLGKLKKAEKIVSEVIQECEGGSENAEKGEYRYVGEGYERFLRHSNSASNPYAKRALARTLQGKVQLAFADYRRAQHFKERKSHGEYISGPTAIEYAGLLIRLGMLSKAHRILLYCLEKYSSADDYPVLAMACELSLADLLRLKGEYQESQKYISHPLAWGIESGHQQIYCWANLSTARLQLAQDRMTEAHSAIQEAQRVATENGFKLYEIDCLTTGGRIAIARKDLVIALEIAQTALCMAGEPNCSYAWGEGNSLHLCGEILVKKSETDEAREFLLRAATIREKIRDPRLLNTQELLRQISNS